jgi:hypothetical protein
MTSITTSEIVLEVGERLLRRAHLSGDIGARFGCRAAACQHGSDTEGRKDRRRRVMRCIVISFKELRSSFVFIGASARPHRSPGARMTASCSLAGSSVHPIAASRHDIGRGATSECILHDAAA